MPPKGRGKRKDRSKTEQRTADFEAQVRALEADQAAHDDARDQAAAQDEAAEKRARFEGQIGAIDNTMELQRLQLMMTFDNGVAIQNLRRDLDKFSSGRMKKPPPAVTTNESPAPKTPEDLILEKRVDVLKDIMMKISLTRGGGGGILIAPLQLLNGVCGLAPSASPTRSFVNTPQFSKHKDAVCFFRLSFHFLFIVHIIIILRSLPLPPPNSMSADRILSTALTRVFVVPNYFHI